jgi:catechol 2,3-dioxygenase-like lactoylglutathione lyase family enzyme
LTEHRRRLGREKPSRTAIALAPPSNLKYRGSSDLGEDGLSRSEPVSAECATMVLNHLNLAVSDVQAAREFLIKYFGLVPEGKQDSNAICLLRDDKGFVLTLTNFEKSAEVRYPGSFHVGFIQESAAMVDGIHRRLTEDGFDIDSPRKLHGSWTFYFHAPGGFLVEVLS